MPRPLKLADIGGVIYDGTILGTGYTLTGATCTTYGAPNTDCVLRPLLTWKAQCDAAVDPLCERPVILIRLDYAYNGPDLGPINFQSQGFAISQPTFPLAATEACTGVIPICTATQAAVCVSSTWTCEEFGL